MKGVIYGTQSKIIRRYIVPGPGETVDYSKHVGPGESFLVIEDNDVPEDAIEAATGVSPPSPRCVVVQGNTVESVINADPDLDGLPGRSLHRHAMAQVGWTRNPNGDFEPPGQGSGSPGK